MEINSKAKAFSKTARRVAAMIFSFFALVVLLTGCSILEPTDPVATEPKIPVDAIFPVMEDEDIEAPDRTIELMDLSLTLPEGYVYGKLENDGYTSYYVWKDRGDDEYILPSNGDILLYVYEGLDTKSPHAELTDSQARSSFLNSYFGTIKNSAAVRITADNGITYTSDDEHYVCCYTGYSGEYFTTTYSAVCYPRTYYGIYALQKVTDTYERRWCGFVFSNDSEGEIFTEGEYTDLMGQIKAGLDITEFYSLAQNKYNYDPMKDVASGRSYEQMLDLFANTYIYYVETIGKPWERENVDPATSDSTAPVSSEVTEGELTSGSETVISPDGVSGPELPADAFSIHFIDVGQADAALVQCDGEYMLIDGGNVGDSDKMYSVLKADGINRLKLVVATHPHEDHVGGLAGALNYAEADTTLCSSTGYESKAFANFAKYADKNGGGITVPSVGDVYTLGSATVAVLGVNAGDGENVNDASIVLKIQYGETSFLFMADAERDAEQALLDSGIDLSSTVLKVGHHGSDSSTTYPFLREVMPKHAIISVGEDNEYEHPTDDVLSRLRDAGVEVWRTDLMGDIYCTSDGKNVSISTENR